MNLYLIDLKEGVRCDYDEFDSFVVAAYNESDALYLTNNRLYSQKDKDIWKIEMISNGSIYSGEPVIVCESFNAR